MNDQNDESVEDAEVVNDSIVAMKPVETGANNQVAGRLNLESLINRYIADIKKSQDSLKMQKDMLEDSFNNDTEYKAQADKVKDATKIKTGIKQRIMKDPSVALLDDKVKSIKEEIKDMQQALSGYVQQYYQTSGTNQIIGDDGEVREIVVVTKLVKRSSKFNP
ncbi:MAG: hypothetical protein HYW86_04005 [Candidatus Roizmanbacteria bacterium]|nr:MAG: hypothetical protein HYW86_04005 [Candidatus Roizmanbacteria bacterium]